MNKNAHSEVAASTSRQTDADVRDAYDLAADVYAEQFIDELSHKPRDMELLQQFADMVGTGGRVTDLGCGPGHTTAHLASLGLQPAGIDLSPAMIARARSLFPHVAFETGDFLQLEDRDNSVSGVLAFYCIVHLPLDQLKSAFVEMRRILKSRGVLFLAFHIGTEMVHVDDFLGSGATLDFFAFSVAEVQAALRAAGFLQIDIHQRPPYPTEYPTDRCYVFAHK